MFAKRHYRENLFMGSSRKEEISCTSNLRNPYLTPLSFSFIVDIIMSKGLCLCLTQLPYI